MPEKKHMANRSTSDVDTPAFNCYMADLLRVEETAPEPDLRQDLVISKLGFVVRAARRIARRYQDAELDILDLVQEGNLALVQAVNEWLDCPPRSAHFQAFITRRVERAIRQYADGARQESARICSLQEHWEELCQAEAPGEFEPEECLIHRQDQEAIIAVLGTLDRRRRKVVALRCGFSDGREMSFEKIGQLTGASRTRAGQLMASATRILRHPSRACKLVGVYRDLG